MFHIIINIIKRSIISIALSIIVLSINGCSRDINSLQVEKFITLNSFNNLKADKGNYITVLNSADKDYYLWISRNIYNVNEPEKFISEYFFEESDCHYKTFFDIIKDNTQCEPDIIGFNFVKKLKPGELFVIMLPEDNKIVDWYKHRITFVPQSLVEGMLGMGIPNRFLFKESLIYLDGLKQNYQHYK